MQNFGIKIVIYTINNFFFDITQKSLEKKGFSIERYSTKLDSEYDYLIVDFSGVNDFDKSLNVLKNSKVKTVSVLGLGDKSKAHSVLSANEYSSVALVFDIDNFDYSEGLIRELFSFGHIGKTFEVEGTKRERVDNIVSIEQTNESDTQSDERKIQPTISKSESKQSLLSPTKSILGNITTTKKIKLPTKNFTNLNKLKVNPKFKHLLERVVKFALLVAFVLSISLIFQSLSLAALYLSGKNILNNSSATTRWLNVSKNLLVVAGKTTFSIPLYRYNVELISSLQTLAGNGVYLTSQSKEFMEKAMGDSVYNVTDVANNISGTLDKTYSDLGFLETLINNDSYFTARVIKSNMTKRGVDIADVRSKVYSAKTVASRIDLLMGAKGPKKYLVVFQNNMELRPTGGFIGSFAVVSVDGGRVLDIDVQDVYSADGQLKGHVEPPAPIKDILGVASWYLRDSNWAPDFAETAQRIEWFLDKEIDQQVDGVVGVDLNLLKGFLDVVGEVDVIDYNQSVTSKNVYQVTQNEVESNFFPGSTKKAGFLTALSRALTFELENMDSSKKPQILKKVYEGLVGKHILAYIHDEHTNQAIKNLGFAGEVNFNKSCGNRCFEDGYGLVDANLGVNKANFFIERDHLLTLNIGKTTISHKLAVLYTNSANSTLGNMGKYKTYTRIVLPVNANVTSVKTFDQTGNSQDIKIDETVFGNRKEVGFVVEVTPLSSKSIEIEWEIKTDSLREGGEYRLKVLKQPGTESDRYAINLGGAELEYTYTTHNFNLLNKTSLTRLRPASYNTRLEKDLDLKVFLQ